MKKITLYHYVHCPFCVRVRIVLTYLNIEFNSVVLPYDDENTPLSLTGVKMLPILTKGETSLNESLDIVNFLDPEDRINRSIFIRYEEETKELLKGIGSAVHALAMPYWIYSPEFDEASRAYFQNKKEQKRGPFNVLVKNKKQFENDLNIIFEKLATCLNPYYYSEVFSLSDILIYSHLVGIYVVPGFNLPQNIIRYMRRIEEISRFSYHEDFWKDNTPLYKKMRTER
jgi:glutaredoxin 2